MFRSAVVKEAAGAIETHSATMQVSSTAAGSCCWGKIGGQLATAAWTAHMVSVEG